MIIYKKTFENIKTLDCNFPIEDCYYADGNMAIVSDGITRDPIGIPNLSKASFSQMVEKYPRPSGGALAAKTITDTFCDKKEETSLKKLLIQANKNVKKLNGKYIKECDYLENDYYGAVASCAKITGNKLEYAYICDCGVLVYDEYGNIKFQTEDDKALVDPYINNIGIPWYLPDARKIVRKDYRNQPDKVENGRCVSYGALTGEEEAEIFIKEGSLKIKDTDLVVVYSDGFTEYFKRKDFYPMIKDWEEKKFTSYVEKLSVEDCEKYGKEKTLVLMKMGEK